MSKMPFLTQLEFFASMCLFDYWSKWPGVRAAFFCLYAHAVQWLFSLARSESQFKKEAPRLKTFFQRITLTSKVSLIKSIVTKRNIFFCFFFLWKPIKTDIIAWLDFPNEGKAMTKSILRQNMIILPKEPWKENPNGRLNNKKKVEKC